MGPNQAEFPAGGDHVAGIRPMPHPTPTGSCHRNPPSAATASPSPANSSSPTTAASLPGLPLVSCHNYILTFDHGAACNSIPSPVFSACGEPSSSTIRHASVSCPPGPSVLGNLYWWYPCGASDKKHGDCDVRHHSRVMNVAVIWVMQGYASEVELQVAEIRSQFGRFDWGVVVVSNADSDVLALLYFDASLCHTDIKSRLSVSFLVRAIFAGSLEITSN